MTGITIRSVTRTLTPSRSLRFYLFCPVNVGHRLSLRSRTQSLTIYGLTLRGVFRETPRVPSRVDRLIFLSFRKRPRLRRSRFPTYTKSFSTSIWTISPSRTPLVIRVSDPPYILFLNLPLVRLFSTTLQT